MTAFQIQILESVAVQHAKAKRLSKNIQPQTNSNKAILGVKHSKPPHLGLMIVDVLVHALQV